MRSGFLLKRPDQTWQSGLPSQAGGDHLCGIQVKDSETLTIMKVLAFCGKVWPIQVAEDIYARSRGSR
jgi:hypothetical protein